MYNFVETSYNTSVTRSRSSVIVISNYIRLSARHALPEFLQCTLRVHLNNRHVTHIKIYLLDIVTVQPGMLNAYNLAPYALTATLPLLYSPEINPPFGKKSWSRPCINCC